MQICFCVLKKKKSNLHLRKIQFYFCVLKKFGSISKGDTNLFYVLKKFRFVSKEDTDLFSINSHSKF